MKKFYLILIGILFSFTMHSQHVFNKGSIFLNLGAGMPYNYGFIPTINFSGEIGVIPTGDIGIVSFGGLTELQFADYDYYYNNSNHTDMKPYFIIGPRASWHLQVFESSQWDVYAGVGFGMAFRGQPYDGYYGSNITGYGEGFVGGRMMFSESFGLFAETGWGSRSFVKFGVTFGM